MINYMKLFDYTYPVHHLR